MLRGTGQIFNGQISVFSFRIKISQLIVLVNC